MALGLERKVKSERFRERRQELISRQVWRANAALPEVCVETCQKSLSAFNKKLPCALAELRARSVDSANSLLH